MAAHVASEGRNSPPYLGGTDRLDSVVDLDGLPVPPLAGRPNAD